MRRVHLFEFGDQTWFPKTLGDCQTEFLEFGANQFDAYKDAVPLLIKGLKSAPEPVFIDMGSGGGGGWKKIIQHLQNANLSFKIKLTDLDPNLHAFRNIQSQYPGIVDFEEESVDATQVSNSLCGFRTMFLSFHHLKPNLARQVLQNAVDACNPIGVFELQDRSVKSLLTMFLTAPISALITAPFIKPFRFSRLFFTYILPVLPLTIWWDGIVSSLRTYNESELKDLIGHVDGQESFQWEVGKVKSGPGFILYLIGTKKA